MRDARKLRLAYFTFFTLEFGGGLAKFFIETALGLKKTNPNWEITIICLDENFTKNIRKILSLYYLRKPLKSYRSNLEKKSQIQKTLGNVRYIKCSSILALLTELNKANVIYSKNELIETFILKIILGYKNLPPVILGFHTPIFYPISHSIHSVIHNLLYNGPIFQYLAGGAHAMHATNLADKIRLNKLFPKKKTALIYYPVDTRRLDVLAKEKKLDYVWDNKKTNILWAGRLIEQKGVVELVSIIDEINKTPYKDSIVFNILGCGPLEGLIKESSEKWNNVKYFGYVENEYMPNVNFNNDLFVSTSGWECFPYNILEAQMMGLPTVSFDIPGANDIINHKETGFLVGSIFEFTQTIIDFVNHPIHKNITKIIRKKFNSSEIYSKLSLLITETSELKQSHQ